MEREQATTEALVLNRELGAARNSRGFYVEQEVRPGDWEPVRQRDKRRWWNGARPGAWRLTRLRGLLALR